MFTWYQANGYCAAQLPAPRSIVLTLEAACNLECGHCCWSHEVKGQWRDWTPYLEQIAAWGGETHITYAGRMLTPRAAEVITALHRRIKRPIEVVDHGYTITRYPELYPYYGLVNISIDGIDHAHDQQRRRKGAAKVAWQAVHELQAAGLEPAVSACVSPVSIRGWSEFEAKLQANGVGVSCAPIYRFSPTVQRGALFFDDQELRGAFEILLAGIPKHIKLYDKRDVRVLLPLLRSARWREEDGTLVGDFAGDITVYYTPLSTARVLTRELRFDGKWVIPAEYPLPLQEERWSTFVATAANNALREERDLINQLLERR